MTHDTAAEAYGFFRNRILGMTHEAFEASISDLSRHLRGGAPAAVSPGGVKRVERDADGRIARIIEEPGGLAAASASSRMGRSGAKAVGNVGIVPITGLLLYRPTWWLSLIGGTSVAEAMADFQTQVAMPGVDAILLLVDSPGGDVSGIPEFAAVIRQAATLKPVVAVADPTAASAAFWLAAQATELVVTPSGEVGSVGVYTHHMDASRAYEAAGLRQTFVQSGKYKTELADTQPLSNDARGYLQQRVDAIEAQFVRDLAIGLHVSESTARSQFGQGRMVDAREAVRRGMAAGVGQVPDALQRAAQLAGGRRLAARVAAEIDQMQAQLGLAMAIGRAAGCAVPSLAVEADRDMCEAHLSLLRAWSLGHGVKV